LPLPWVSASVPSSYLKERSWERGGRADPKSTCPPSHRYYCTPHVRVRGMFRVNRLLFGPGGCGAEDGCGIPGGRLSLPGSRYLCVRTGRMGRESKGEGEEENGAKGEHMKRTYELMEYPSHDCIDCVSLNFIQPHISQQCLLILVWFE
jgi:hypothetical protein